MMSYLAFQSTHPRGVRQRAVLAAGKIVQFQSTHPRGVRHLISSQVNLNEQISIHAPTWGATISSGVYPLTTLNFNPRTHVGCDACATWEVSTSPISIHAPTWGATGLMGRGLDSAKISIHAPTWGATEEARRPFVVVDISIHAPTWGATQARQDGAAVFRISIHAPTWGATS